MTHHIFTMTEIILINTGTWKHFLRYMYQKVLPAMFMNITTPPYHLTEFKLCRVRNSARSVESYCTFVTYHIRTLKSYFITWAPSGRPSNKGCETGPTVYRPYPSRLESLTICRCITKAAISPQSFKDPEWWSGWGF